MQARYQWAAEIFTVAFTLLLYYCLNEKTDDVGLIEVRFHYIQPFCFKKYFTKISERSFE